MEHWSGGVVRHFRNPILHYSTTPSLQSLSEHLPKLVAPALQLLVARQSHDHDLVVFHIVLELMVRFGMKDVFAEAAEDA
jgi:hypothetical protein